MKLQIFYSLTEILSFYAFLRPGDDEPDSSSMMGELLGICCTDARLYTLRIKIGLRTTSGHER